MFVNPIKLLKGLYYANKPTEAFSAKKALVKIEKGVPAKTIEKINPYMNGISQLAEKYKINIVIEPLPGNYDVYACAKIGDTEKNAYLYNQMDGATMTREIYKKIGDVVKFNNLMKKIF